MLRMRHNEHGIHHAHGGEVEDLKKLGWFEEPKRKKEVEEVQEEKPETPKRKYIKRK